MEAETEMVRAQAAEAHAAARTARRAATALQTQEQACLDLAGIFPPAVGTQAIYMAQAPEMRVKVSELCEMAEWMHTGHLVPVARWLQSEVSIRCAHRIRELRSMPYGLGAMPSIMKPPPARSTRCPICGPRSAVQQETPPGPQVRAWYTDSLSELLEMQEINTQDDEAELARRLQRIYRRQRLSPLPTPWLYVLLMCHSPESSSTTLAGAPHNGVNAGTGDNLHSHPSTLLSAPHTDTLPGVLELKEKEGLRLGRRGGAGAYPELAANLDALFNARVGIRLLIAQHLAIKAQHAHRAHEDRGAYGNPGQAHPSVCLGSVGMGRDCMEGIVHPGKPLAEIISESVNYASQSVEKVHGEDMPEVEVVGDTSAALRCVPKYLFYAFAELLKNSLSATCRFCDGLCAPLPPARTPRSATACTIGHRARSCSVLSIRNKNKRGVGPYLSLTVADAGKEAIFGQNIFLHVYHWPSDRSGAASAATRPSRAWGSPPQGQLMHLLAKLGTEGWLNPDSDYQDSEDCGFGPLLWDTRSKKSWEDYGPLAGTGFGLPVSRLYTRYFGGDLQMETLPGYGTNVYLYLPKQSSLHIELISPTSVSYIQVISAAQFCVVFIWEREHRGSQLPISHTQDPDATPLPLSALNTASTAERYKRRAASWSEAEPLAPEDTA
eukprot:gene3690-686_t